MATSLIESLIKRKKKNDEKIVKSHTELLQMFNIKYLRNVNKQFDFLNFETMNTSFLCLIKTGATWSLFNSDIAPPPKNVNKIIH